MTKRIEIVTVNPALSNLDTKLKLWLSLIILVGVLVVGVAIVTDRLYNPEHFNIHKISLTGDAAHVDRVALKRSVIESIDGNYFSLDSQKILAVVQRLPWVEKVSLRRQWPATLLIDIEEYQPVAIWGENRWLTTTGKLVELPLPKNVVLPQLNGASDEVDMVWYKYKDWSVKFARQGLRLRHVELSKQHIYSLRLEYSSLAAERAKGFEMILAEANADQQMEAFLSSYRLSLIDAPGRIKTVDLRYPNGFSVSQYPLDDIARVDSNK